VQPPENGREEGLRQKNSAAGHRTLYIFSLEMFSKSLDVIFFSTASTIPSFARMPTQIPACEIASIAYSTWYRRPSGENVVVRESYRRACTRHARCQGKYALARSLLCAH
jgi:hypothetical protein